MTRPRSKARVRLLSWQRRLIQVRYEPKWLGQHGIAHMAIRCLDPPNGPLPITETGYISSFFHAEDDELPGDTPVAYVRRWLDDAARDRRWIAAEDAGRQLALF